MSRFRPLNDFVSIRPDEAKTETEGGIAIADVAQERPREGTVLACGPGRFMNGVMVAMEARVGDKVSFGRYAGTDLEIDGEPIIVMREEEILGVHEPEINKGETT